MIIISCLSYECLLENDDDDDNLNYSRKNRRRYKNRPKQIPREWWMIQKSKDNTPCDYCCRCLAEGALIYLWIAVILFVTITLGLPQLVLLIALSIIFSSFLVFYSFEWRISKKNVMLSLATMSIILATVTPAVLIARMITDFQYGRNHHGLRSSRESLRKISGFGGTSIPMLNVQT